MSELLVSSDSALHHVAIIMDGNNRWARQHKVKGLAGHHAGAERLREVVDACKTKNIQVLTVFAFSSENWRRPKAEVKGLMSLFTASLKRYKTELKEQNVALKVIGRRDRFSSGLQKLISNVEAHTADGERTLVVAADYGGKWDMANAAKCLAEQVSAGRIAAADINEELLARHLSMANLPPVDLLIRTGAESRISNFLLWQIAYAELYFANCYWPDFDEAEFNKALEEFYSRQRRFGDNPEPLEGVGTKQGDIANSDSMVMGDA